MFVMHNNVKSRVGFFYKFLLTCRSDADALFCRGKVMFSFSFLPICSILTFQKLDLVF